MNLRKTPPSQLDTISGIADANIEKDILSEFYFAVTHKFFDSLPFADELSGCSANNRLCFQMQIFGIELGDPLEFVPVMDRHGSPRKGRKAF
jgi:hypothetical protein